MNFSHLALAAFFVSAIATLVQLHLLFTRLANKYPNLYDKLGKPSLMGGSPFKGTSAGFVLFRLIFTSDAEVTGDRYLHLLHVGLRAAFFVEIVAWLGLVLSIGTKW